MVENPERPPVLHAPSDETIRVRPAGLMILLLAFVTVLLAAAVLAWGIIYATPVVDTAPAGTIRPRAVPLVEPRLQTSPETDLARLREREYRQLHREGIDPVSGFGWLTIDKAMALSAKRARQTPEVPR